MPELRCLQGQLYRRLVRLAVWAALGIPAAVVLSGGFARAQSYDPPGLHHYPVRMPPGEFRSSFDITFARAPEDIIEEASFIRAPLFTWDVRYGLPQNFHLTGAITSQIVTNHFALGASWIYPFDRLHLEVGYQLAYWFGFLNIDGFDNSARGWINYPGLAVGYDFGPLALTLRGTLSLVTNLGTYVGDIGTSTDLNFFNGGSVSLVMEQPLWKDHYVTLGFRYNYVKFFYPTWPLFPTFNRYYYIPEVIVGIRL